MTKQKNLNLHRAFNTILSYTERSFVLDVFSAVYEQLCSHYAPQKIHWEKKGEIMFFIFVFGLT